MRLRLPGGMYGFIIRRLLLIIPIMFVVTIFVFMLLPLTGDPARQVLRAQGVNDPTLEQIEVTSHRFGFHRPLYIQYIRWLTGWPPADPTQGEDASVMTNGLLRGDLGYSYTKGEPVLGAILERLPNTLTLTIAAFTMSLAIGLLIGIISALRRKTWVDYLCMGTTIFGVSIPFFWLGLMMLLIFQVWLGWYPYTPYGLWVIFPAFALATHQSASLARMTRSSMLDVLRQDYIRTARAKGLREKTVIYTHALRNAFIPVATLLFLRLPFLFGGTVIMEVIFRWPGMGQLLVSAMGGGAFGASGGAKDWFLVQGGVLMFLILAVVANLLCDITYAYLNPKIRYGESK